jgi:hypothetical protein
MTATEIISLTGQIQNKVNKLHVPAGDIKLSNGILLKQRTKRDDLPIAEGRYQVLEYGVWVASDKLVVIASLDRTHHGELLHVSCSYPKRDPGWGVIKAVRYAFFPSDIDVSMILPRDGDYINVMTHCFQMWQMPEKWGIQ